MTPLQQLRDLWQMLRSGRQATRLLRLSFPNDDGPAALLLVNRLAGVESLSRDFDYTVELLSDSATIPLEALQGKLLCISLVQADGGLRSFTGYVARSRLVRTDGGVAFYEATLVPWLRHLELRQNNRLFHELTLQEQLRTIFQDYGALPRMDWQVRGDEPRVTMATQWAETDHNYVSRRLEAAGFSYRYDHAEDGHTLVVQGTTLDAPPIAGASPAVRFHAEGGPLDVDAVSRWSPVRPWAPAHAAVSAFDFKRPRPEHADVTGIDRQGDVPKLQVHRYEGHYGFRPDRGGDDLARLRIEEIEARGGKRFEAEGNCSRIAAGRWFRLSEHFDHSGDDAEFLVLEVHHSASNNYLQAVETPAEYRNRFTCQRKRVHWRPGEGFNSTPTRLFGLQTAIVTGPDGSGSLHVDEHGRVRLRFHWDRSGSSSCWVRVASPWAGGEKGFASPPRVGSEVVVQWLDGNPDHPIVTGGVHNERFQPPWQLPAQQALTGLRSRELTPGGGNAPGGRSNHLVLDDTAGELQAQLRSDHQASELALGHIRRIEDTAGRKDARGQGFELRTDGHGAVRAGKGLLLTTEARQDARAHMTDIGETVGRLAEGRQLHDHLATAARQAKAHDAGDQDAVVAALAEQIDALGGRGGASANGRFPEFQAPHLALASPAGIETSTPGSTHLASGEHMAVTSGGHASVVAGKSLLVSVKDAVRLFAYNAGMRLVAAGADIDITALKQSVNILAKLSITQTADRITITAKEQVLINGGGSYSRWDSAGIVHGTNGVWTEKAASHRATGPDNLPGPALPAPIDIDELIEKRSLVFHLNSHAAGGRPMANEPYALYKGGALVEKGVTDAAGDLVIKDHRPGTTAYTVELSNGARFDLAVHPKLDPDNAGQHLSNQGYRGPKGDASRADDYGNAD